MRLAAEQGIWQRETEFPRREAEGEKLRKVWQIVKAHQGPDGDVEFYSTMAIERTRQTDLEQVRLRGHDRLARLGGDEFAVLLSGAPGERAKAIAERLLEHLQQSSVSVDGHTLSVGANIGVAVYLDDGNTVEEILIQADLAMYAAKRDGGGGVAVCRG